MNLKRATMVLLALALALPALAGSDALLSSVPADAVSVGMVRVDALKSGQFGGMLFEQTSDITTDGEALAFLQEAGLNPMSDVDTVVFAMLPSKESADEGELLFLVQGRFDPARLGSSVARRGALPASAGGTAYFTMNDGDSEESDHRHDSFAVSFASAQLTIAGTEPAVVRALETIAAGGSNFVAASNIGRDLKTINRNASAWAMMDVQRSARMGRSMTQKLEDEHAQSFGKALRYVSTMGVWATEKDGNLEFGGVALSSDEETRVLLEDVVRGITAAWRMAAREDNPEWLPVIRSFDIGRDGVGVNIKGAVPIALLKDHQKAIASK